MHGSLDETGGNRCAPRFRACVERLEQRLFLTDRQSFCLNSIDSAKASRIDFRSRTSRVRELLRYGMEADYFISLPFSFSSCKPISYAVFCLKKNRAHTLK